MNLYIVANAMLRQASKRICFTAPSDAVHRVSFAQQEPRQITAILARDPCDEGDTAHLPHDRQMAVPMETVQRGAREATKRVKVRGGTTILAISRAAGLTRTIPPFARVEAPTALF
jgi:hypothetical protein